MTPKAQLTLSKPIAHDLYGTDLKLSWQINLIKSSWASAVSNCQKKPTFWEPSLSPSSGVWCEWIPGTSSNTNGWVESSVCYVWPVLGGVVHVGLAESSRPNAKSMRYMSHYLQKSAVVEHSTEAEHRIDSTESL